MNAAAICAAADDVHGAAALETSSFVMHTSTTWSPGYMQLEGMLADPAFCCRSNSSRASKLSGNRTQVPARIAAGTWPPCNACFVPLSHRHGGIASTPLPGSVYQIRNVEQPYRATHTKGGCPEGCFETLSPMFQLFLVSPLLATLRRALFFRRRSSRRPDTRDCRLQWAGGWSQHPVPSLCLGDSTKYAGSWSTLYRFMLPTFIPEYWCRCS